MTMLLEEAIPLYIRTAKSRGRQQRGIDRYVQDIRWFIQDAGNREIDSITSIDIEEYLETLSDRCKVKTVKSALSSLRSFFNWAMRRGHRTDDPTLGIPSPKEPDCIPSALDESELSKLLQAINTIPAGLTLTRRWHWTRNARLVYLMLYAGLRMQEVVDLRWRDVDFKANTLLVRNGKGGRCRALPLHPRLRAILHAAASDCADDAVVGIRSGAPTSRDHDRIFREWLPRLGVTGIHAHRLRHTFATELLRNKVDIRSIQVLMGHKDISTTMRYLRVDPSWMQESVNLLPEW